MIPSLVAIQQGWLRVSDSFDRLPYVLQCLNITLLVAAPWAIAFAIYYLLPFRVVRILAFFCYGILGLMWLTISFNLLGWLALAIREMSR